MTELHAREKIDDLAGRICKKIFPIEKEYYPGRGHACGICTLSSLELLEGIARMQSVMDRIAIVGRLLSENKGIDAMIKFAIEHPDLKLIILCGKEVKGHRAGQALVSLAKNGTDFKGRIIGASGPYPLLQVERDSIEKFRRQVIIVDMIGSMDINKITGLIA